MFGVRMNLDGLNKFPDESGLSTNKLLIRIEKY
jgi:hypothetical protein